MSIKDVIEWVGSRTVVPSPALPQQPRMAKMREIVEERLDAVYAKASGLDLEELHNRIRGALAAGKLGSLSNAEWRYVPLCLLMGAPRLIEETRFMEAYVRRLQQQTNRLTIRHLIRFYLNHFDPGVSGIRLIGKFLAEGVKQWGKEWSDRHYKVGLFDPDMAPLRLGYKALQAEEPPINFLSGMGFDRSLSSARLAGYAFLEALKKLYAELLTNPSMPWIQRVAAWGMDENKQFRYGNIPGARGKLAEALLLPWEKRDPPQEVKDFTERFILAHYKDLRINHARWNDVSEDARRIMRRWLTKASLDWFLNVVDETATDEDSRRMWPARRKFWGAYYTRGYMQEAWVVFGRAGSEHARRLSTKSREDAASFMSFGRIQGGARSNHAVLLMRIGDLTIADWNFMGKCHIWLGDNPKAPDLYRTEYDRFDLSKNSDFQQVHLGVWQVYVYDFVLKHTQAFMHRPEYV